MELGGGVARRWDEVGVGVSGMEEENKYRRREDVLWC